MRVLALLACHNEERFIAGCVEHLAQQGVDVYLIDNESSDATVEIAERYVGRGLVGIETLPRGGAFSLHRQLMRKSELAATFEADWFLHVDSDEIRLPPRSSRTLGEALEDVNRRGYNAVNFQEFTFVPTREHPDHDHPDFRRTMRWYYPFLPQFPHRLNAWTRQDEPVDLASAGGHRVDFPGLRMYPQSFPMRHYLFLSVEHAIRKYASRTFDPDELAQGWHGGRASLRDDGVTLLSERELRTYESDDFLDASEPWLEHPLFAARR